MLFKNCSKPNIDWYWVAYGKGAFAGTVGDSKDTNPYDYGTEEHDAWIDGWYLKK